MRVLNIAVITFNFAYGAFAFMLLWNWFVVTLGAPRIGFAHAAGLTLFAMLTQAELVSSVLLKTETPLWALEIGVMALITGALIAGFILHLAS